MVPDSILTEIIARARDEWPSDKQMQKHTIMEEKGAYEKLQSIDFGDLENIKTALIDSAKAIYDEWTLILEAVEAELDACETINTFSVDGISEQIINDWKKEAVNLHEGDYSEQLEYLINKVQKHESVLLTRQQIDPIRRLLIELEEIVGSECYNGNIQNYGSWGELESEGRKFRYPVKFYTSSGERKQWAVSRDTLSEELITGHYAFGANELNIYRALYKVVMHLRENYGLKI